MVMSKAVDSHLELAQRLLANVDAETCDLADALGMRAVIVPAGAGVLSAVGLVTSPVERELVRSWPGGASLEGLDAAARPSEVRRVLDREPVEAAALAGGEHARRWIAEWRHVRPALSGADLLAAGLRGPALGAALDAATDALLDGRAPDRESQLAVALASGAAPPPRPPA